MVPQVGTPVDRVADAVSTGLLLTTRDGIPRWHNQAIALLIDQSALDQLPLSAVQPGGAAVEVPFLASQSGHRWLQILCRPVGDCLLYEMTDVTARRIEQVRSGDNERLLAHTERLAKVGSWEWDLATNRIRWSAALLESFGFPPETALDYETYRSLLHPEDLPLIEDTLDQALREARPFTYTHRMYLADRTSLRVFECYGEVFANSAGTPVRVLGVAHDITEIRKVQAELVHLADHDPLTGLVNRRVLTNHLNQLLSAQTGGALLIIDIDNFKDINDVRGHAVGDEVMRRLARMLPEWLPEAAVVGRLAGDEFAVILPGCSPDDALTASEALCDIAASTPLVIFGETQRVTFSIGAAPVDAEQDCEALLAHADLALRQAKAAGRNRATLFAPEQYHHAVQRVSIVRRVREALSAGRLELDAQPIVDLTSGHITSFELLVRLRDGIYPEVGPADFLPTLERGDLVLELDRWVIEQAIIALARPAARYSGLCLDVNVSSRSMDDPGFGDWVVTKLRQMGVEPPRLGLEITETTAIANLDAAQRLAAALAEVGCRFSLDDFGAGFGSFVYLKHLPFTTVKIAGEFVRQADAGGVDAVLVDAVVRAATGLGMTTVAEYIDREPLVTVLRDLGVDRGQGFHLGRPTPLKQIILRTEDAPTQLLPRAVG